MFYGPLCETRGQNNDLHKYTTKGNLLYLAENPTFVQDHIEWILRYCYHCTQSTFFEFPNTRNRFAGILNKQKHNKTRSVGSGEYAIFFIQENQNLARKKCLTSEMYEVN